MTKVVRNYAMECNYPSYKGHLGIENDRLVVTNKPYGGKQSELAAKIVKDVLADTTLENNSLKLDALMSINAGWKRKLDSPSTRLFYDTKDLVKSVNIVDDAIAQLGGENAIEISEESFRTRFISIIPLHLKVYYPPSDKNIIHHRWKDGTEERREFNEEDFVKWFSEHIFKSQEIQLLPDEHKWEHYFSLMKGAYSGDHVLIEEKDHHKRIDDLVKMGAILRTSHQGLQGKAIEDWDKDTGLPKFSGDLHADMKNAKNKHYGLTGKHVRHVLFYETKLFCTKHKELISGETAQQIEKRVQATNNKGKRVLRIGSKDYNVADIDFSRKYRFVAVQFQPSSNSEGRDFTDWKFYVNRIMRYIIKTVFTWLGIKKSNLGAYGIGKSEEDPIILEYGRPNRLLPQEVKDSGSVVKRQHQQVEAVAVVGKSGEGGASSGDLSGITSASSSLPGGDGNTQAHRIGRHRRQHSVSFGDFLSQQS